MNPKIEEIVKSLRGCKAGIAGGCRDCLMHEKSGCINALHDAAADLIEQLQQELIDERYRHDRYADFCVAQGEELSEYKRRLHAVIALLNGDENLVVTGLPEEADILCK